MKVFRYTGKSEEELRMHHRNHCPLVFADILCDPSQLNKYYKKTATGFYFKCTLTFFLEEELILKEGRVYIGVSNKNKNLIHCQFVENREASTDYHINLSKAEQGELLFENAKMKEDGWKNVTYKFEKEVEGVLFFSFDHSDHLLIIHPIS